MRRRSAMLNGADLCAELLADFERVLGHQQSTEVVLAEAAHVSGYSGDHLRRLHREGRLPARCVGRRLFFRLADLPKKPEPLAAATPKAYDPAADARQVATRRNTGVVHG